MGMTITPEGRVQLLEPPPMCIVSRELHRGHWGFRGGMSSRTRIHLPLRVSNRGPDRFLRSSANGLKLEERPHSQVAGLQPCARVGIRRQHPGGVGADQGSTRGARGVRCCHHVRYLGCGRGTSRIRERSQQRPPRPSRPAAAAGRRCSSSPGSGSGTSARRKSTTGGPRCGAPGRRYTAAHARPGPGSG